MTLLCNISLHSNGSPNTADKVFRSAASKPITSDICLDLHFFLLNTFRKDTNIYTTNDKCLCNGSFLLSKRELELLDISRTLRFFRGNNYLLPFN